MLDLTKIEAGTLIDKRYQIKGLLGKGGMGTVYLAIDKMLGNRQLAIKFLDPSLYLDENAIKRFLLEIQVTLDISHPNIARSYDVGFVNSKYPYFTMEYVEGVELSDFFDNHQNPEDIALSVLTQVCSALEHLHSKGILHRDIKPSNILITKNGHAFITDFGIVKSKTSKLTTGSTILGTHDFIPPEVWEGLNWTEQSDIYCLGLTLYRAVVGEYAFDEEELAVLIKSVLMETPDSPKNRNPKVSQKLSDLIMKMIERDTDLRFASATEILKEVSSTSVNPKKNIKILTANKHFKMLAIAFLVVLISVIGFYRPHEPNSEITAKSNHIIIKKLTNGTEKTKVKSAIDKEKPIFKGSSWELEIAIEKNPSNFRLVKTLATERENKGQLRAAAEVYSDYLESTAVTNKTTNEVKKEHIETYKQLTRLLKRLGVTDKANEYEKKLKLLKGNY